MMGYKIVGKIRNKEYVSKSFKTDTEALKSAYKLVYKKDGNTKRKNQLHDFRIVKTTKPKPKLKLALKGSKLP